MNPCVLASDDEQLIRRLRAVVGDADEGGLRVVPGVFDRHTADRIIKAFHGGPGVVVIGQDVKLDVALELAVRIDLEHPEIATVLVGGGVPDVLPRAMRAGVRDTLDPEASQAEIREVVDRAGAAAARRFESLAPHGEHAPHGKIITVLSPKGGSGKTTIATNLAVALASVAPQRVVIVDADLQFGDLITSLGILPEHTLEEGLRPDGPIDSMGIKSLLFAHPSGCFVLAAPTEPADGEQVNAEHLAAMVTLLAGEFDYLVIDTSAGLPEATLALIEISTDLVLVASMEVPSIRQLRKEIDALDAVGMVEQTRHLVINRADSKVGLSVDDVEAAIGLPAAVALPSSREVPLSLNQGMPLVTSQPRSHVTRALVKLAARFTPESASVDKPVFRRGWGRGL